MSGIQPTGVPHLGNYLGAIKPWVEQQNQLDGREDSPQMLISIVDMHSLTSIKEDDKALDQQVLEMAANLIACGIDHKKTVLFQQSRVRGHSELAWILSCLCTMPTITHQPQWKLRAATWPEDRLSVGLLTYPVLQAADVLLYRATHVPVGEDQVIHMEMIRHLVRRFHARYLREKSRTIFPEPATVMEKNGMIARVLSLRDPEKKMSKSEPDIQSRIELLDSDDAIRKKIRVSITDSIKGNITYDPINRPGVANLVNLAAALSGQPLSTMIDEASNLKKVQLKDLVSSIVIQHLTPIREKILELQNERKEELLAALEDGNSRAQEVAETTMKDVNTAVYGRA